MKKLIISLLILTVTATCVKAQDIVISERTATKIENIKAKAVKEATDADNKMLQEIEKAKRQVEIDAQKAAQDAKKKMEEDTRKGAEKAQQKAEKAIAKSKEKAEKAKLKAQQKADAEIAKIRAKENIGF